MTFSRTPFGQVYFAAQALAFAAWWAYLWAVPAARASFFPPGASEIELLAFALPDLGVAVLGSLGAAIAIASGARWAVPLAWLTAGAVVYAAAYCVAWAALRDGGWLSVALMAPAALLSTLAALDVSVGVIVVFRRAAPSTGRRHVVATLLQVVAFWTTFLYVLPSAVVYLERRLGIPGFSFSGQTAVAVTLFLLCSALGLVSGVTMAWRGSGTPIPFDGPNRLVVQGPYAYLRNPMVVAGLGQGIAVGIAFGSFSVLGYAVAGGLVWQLLARPAEEADLLETFGDEYSAYCDQVRCWFPRRQPYRQNERASRSLWKTHP